MNSKIFGKRIKAGVLLVLLPSFAFLGTPLEANPRGGQVVLGDATIQRVNANQLLIHQRSQSAIINWDDFSIARGDLTQFRQPNRNASVLNRVTTGNVSQIHGQLKANGNVFVVNPNGIVIGQTGVVDVAGNAVFSTLDIDDEDFLDGGNNRFYGGSTTGVTNRGTISSTDGDVILLGGFVDNQGQIGALNGTVALGSGGEILVREEAGSKISIQGGSDYDGTGVSNTGSIRGASAELKAHGNVYALAINNGGAIRASGATRANGRVRLEASGGSSNINLGNNSTIVARSGPDGGSIEVSSAGGDVTVGGSVDASGAEAGGEVSIAGQNVTQEIGSTVSTSGGLDAGSVSIDAEKVTAISGTVTSEGEFGTGGNVDITGANILIDDGAAISANGSTAGGTVRIGGDFQGRDTGLREADRTAVGENVQISVDAAAGDAGIAIVWANGDTMFYGDISANANGAVGNGGLIEVSGKQHLLYDGNASATTLGGRSGTILFDPGDVVIGAVGANPAPLGSPIFDSTVSRQAINETLQGGTSVLIATESGSISFESPGNGGFDNDGNALNDRHRSIQWTNSLASFGAFASENILIENHIRTSGGGSINLMAGWSGLESDGALSFDPQSAWDFYVGQGQFGEGGGSIFVGNTNMNRHLIVGSRFGDTNLAAFDVRVQGSNTNSYNRFAQVGFNDMGNVFAPRLNNGGGIVLDLTQDIDSQWYLSDGLNDAAFNGGVLDNNVLTALTSMPSNGAGSPIVGVVGRFEVDMNGDGIADGVRGIGSAAEDTSDGVVDGILKDTFIPYANHYDSAGSGNWWWQQIEQAAGTDADGNVLAGSLETKDPLGLGGLRPENGAGSATNGADINVLARGNVLVGAGSGREHVSASIGHGGNGRASWGGANTSTRETGNETVGNAGFSDAGIERGQLERRWTINGSTGDRNSTSIARLAPVYGNINVLAGVDVSFGANVSHLSGTVTATVGTGGSVVVRAANQDFETGNQSFNSFAQVGHGGIGQFGEYYGDIFVEAGGEVVLEAGNATRSHATIGHTFNGHAYWNPTSVVDQQIRFFATTGDFDNPNLRRGELFSGVNTTGFDPALDPVAGDRYTLANFPLDDAGPDAVLGTADDINSTLGFNPLQYTRGDDNRGAHSQGTNALAPLDLAPVGPETVNALNGSVVSGLHGDVTVIAGSGDVDVIAYSTPEDVNIGGRNGAARDRRFAGIGHGGSNFSFWTEGSGYIGIDGVPDAQLAGNPLRPDAREIVVWEAGTDQTGANPDTTTGSRSQVGNIGSDRGRSMLYMSITGDINVRADENISVVAGNDTYDYARIGHGGAEVADSETSSFMLGDISVQAGGDLLVQGGGSVPNNARFRNQRNFDMHAWAIVGHGGYRNGFYDFTGDIDVSVDGNVTISGGAHTDSGAKIGHQTVESWGQSGGDFSRDENFRRDSVSTDVTSTLSNAGATIDYTLVTAANPNYLTLPANRTFDTAGTSIGDRNTANINVRAGGGVTLNHLALGNRLNARQIQFQADEPGSTETVDPDNQGQGARTRRGFSMIGHGGRGVDSFRETNINANYGDKAGNITVIAELGDITLENGAGEQRWTRIGHGFDRNDRADGNTAAYSRGVEIIGDITVSASGNISVNALAADANEQDANTDALFGPAAPSRWNPVVIGHGGVLNNLDLVVLNDSENVNGILASSNIAINAGGDLEVLAGLGTEASFAQVGHGFASDQGNDAARRLGQATGFNGDISVNVLGDLSVIGGPSAWSGLPDGITDNSGQSVIGAFAAIGNGGYQLDAPATGDISIYVEGDATIAGQQVADTESTDEVGGPYNVLNPDTGFLASAFNFGKVGHVSVENSNRQGGNGDLVTNANMEGDITVVVNSNLSLLGGTTPDVDEQTIYGAFGQIGHGGPGIAGDLDGNITVLVRDQLTVTGGSDIEDGDGGTTRALNNYAMIGNGTRIYDPVSSPSALFRVDGQGIRGGDIVVATGGNGNFTDALIGHADPAVSTQTTFGNTQVAVSRLNPFFGGDGLLTATENTVFSSGGFGAGSQLELYMPARSNNFMDNTVRLNEATAGYTVEPGNFEDPFPGTGIFAGRDDEVYLTPDLWWDQAGVAAEFGVIGAGVFPTDASGDQGGAIANVADPGGLFNFTSLVAGALGSSASAYRGGNGVSGSGNYTIYYDAIELITITSPPFEFAPFLFTEKFESFERFTELLDNELAGTPDYALFAGLGLFETDEETVEESGAWKVENRLDNMFGSRRDSFSFKEEAEEEERRRKRGGQVGSIGLTFYVFEPGTNQYSSYRVLGNSLGSFYPANQYFRSPE